jgi:hypothetical protein
MLVEGGKIKKSVGIRFGLAGGLPKHPAIAAAGVAKMSLTQ